jgi:putative membrane protein
MLVATVPWLACSRESTTMTPASRTVDSGSTRTPSDDSLTDEQIIGITLVANSVEVQQGKIAMRMAQRADVREFASMVVDEHMEALEAQRELETRLGLSPAGSDAASDLRAENTEVVTSLNETKLAEFDREYIDAQVETHEEVLALLDERLIPSVQNPEIRRSLETMRPRVKVHLDRAKEIQKMLE